ncbi:hypothetical protein BdWA1_002779 [Babesia duncani]|uniref:Uncharacterized protein n=1 Tax=Babesia duncani TaxID=323732 RepID=A0AAD9UNR1_9APIC|nr:hypothetical protein BdWA1_002779 [Babesia duncani]
MFNAQVIESIETFKKARSLVQQALDGELNEKQRKNMSDTLEDVGIQIADLERIVAAKQLGTTKGSQSNASECIPRTTDHFDAKTVNAEPVKIVAPLATQGDQKRRIDLSALAPAKRQDSLQDP